MKKEILPSLAHFLQLVPIISSPYDSLLRVVSLG